MRREEIEFLIQAAIDNGDDCRAWLWLKHSLKQLSQLPKSPNASLLELSMSSEASEHCEQDFCASGQGCHEGGSQHKAFANLCRDPDLYSQLGHRLKCVYWTPHPMFFYQPLKVQWLRRSPKVSAHCFCFEVIR